MENTIIQIQDDILREAWKAGALNDEWYNKWIEDVYVGHSEKGEFIIKN